MGKQVLVTGASGFIAQQLILDLLEAGHTVRGTIRSLGKADALGRVLAGHDPRASDVEFVAADLERDDGWAAAVAGIDVVHHVASPFPMGEPKDPMDLIRPARDGTLRVLRAAKAAGVAQVVLTSSFAAVGYGHAQQPAMCTEADWTNPDNTADCTPYVRSKAIAERAAWDFARAEGLALTTINPVGVFGPIRSGDVRTSVGIVGQLLNGDFPALPKAGIQVVDVRDVSAAHIAAMNEPSAIGERYLLASDYFTMRAFTEALRETFPAFDAKLPKRDMPDFVVRLLALFSADMKTIAQELGKRRICSNEKVKALLGRELIPGREAIAESGKTLIKYGAV